MLTRIQSPLDAGQFQVWKEVEITISEANWYFSMLLMIDHISEDLKDL